MRTKTPVPLAYMVAGVAAAIIVVGVQPGRGTAPLLPTLPISGAQWVFQAPSGWHRVQATTLGLGVWVHPGNTRFQQTVSARADHFDGTLSELSQKAVSTVKSRYPDAKLGAMQHTRVCGSHPAAYLSYAATVKGEPAVVEQMLTLFGHTAYAATYTRASRDPSIPAARQSLTTLCGGHPPPGVAPSPIGVMRPAATANPERTPHTMQTSGAPAPTVTPLPAATVTAHASPQPMQTSGYPVPTVTPNLGGS